MLENDQSFIYEKDEDEINLKMDKLDTEPNKFNTEANYNSLSSIVNTSLADHLKENFSSASNLNKDAKYESQNNLKVKEFNNNNYDTLTEKQQFSRTINRRKRYVEDEGPKIISLDQVPLFRKLFISVHPFVLNGYRIHHNARDCFFSMFKLHNETLNIWTHFLPFWGFLVLAIHLFSSI